MKFVCTYTLNGMSYKIGACGCPYNDLVIFKDSNDCLALCYFQYFTVVMELPDSLWMNCKSEFGVIFLKCSPR